MNEITQKPLDFLIAKADSVSKVRDAAWKQKEELAKQGIITEIHVDNNIYFGQNCYTTDKLDIVYFVIGMMIKNDNWRIRIVGNLDKYEAKNNPKLSFKRAKFIRAIMIEHGIEVNRIEILDAKSDRPYVPQTDGGSIENRRIDFEIISK